jgi:hypothetical protein
VSAPSVDASQSAGRLRSIRIAHTVAWAFFAGCILGIPVAAWRDSFRLAAVLTALVSVELVILAANGCRCPLTAVAARYTEDRRPNFDIYLPEWLARYNKEIFGTLLVAGLVYAVLRWKASTP